MPTDETDALHWAFDSACKVRPGALRKYADHPELITCATCLSRFDAPIRTEPKDPRPDDPAELARQVAIELRKHREAWHQGGAEVWVIRLRGSPQAPSVRQFCHSLFGAKFDNLGPVGCAAVIQVEEVKRTQEWAGDK